MAAARLTYPLPNDCHLFYPSGDVETTQIKKMTYPMMLMIPYAIMLAPNSKYLRTKMRIKRTRVLERGLAMLSLPTIPSH
jgi:hypothetical protein